MDTGKIIKGVKVKMTQFFESDGAVVPVTVVSVAKENTSEFNKGEVLRLSGLTKGKGFAGVVKRWGFSGGPATHGSGWSRKPGSIGGTTFPGRVYRGKKMPGHMGNRKVTVSGLKVVSVDGESGLILVSGAVPGANGSVVAIQKKS